MPIVPTLKRQNRVNVCEFETNLVYIVCSRPFSTTYRVSLSQTNKHSDYVWNHMRIYRVIGDSVPGNRCFTNQQPHFSWSLEINIWARALSFYAHLSVNHRISHQGWTIIDIVTPVKYENCHNKSNHAFRKIYSNLKIDQYDKYFHFI